MCAEEGDERRICEIVDKAIEDGTIESTPKYRTDRAKIMKGAKAKSRKSHAVTRDRDGDEQALALSILNNHNSRSQRMASIVSKYVTEDEFDDDISDAAFAEAQKRVSKTDSGARNTGSSHSSKKAKKS